MTTQLKKTAGGTFAALTTDAAGRATTADATIAAGAAGTVSQLCSAASEWRNAHGAGDGAMRAQKYANAVGVTLQEV